MGASGSGAPVPAPASKGAPLGKGKPDTPPASETSERPSSRNIAVTIADEVGRGDMAKVKTSSEMFKGLHGHRLQVNHYATAIVVCAKDNNMEGAVRLWERMREEQLKPDLRCYRVMIAAHHRCRDWEKMLMYCNEMHAEGTVADAQTYRAVLSSLEKAGQFEKVLSLVEEFMSSELNIDLSLSCDSVLSSCAKLSRVENAAKFWKYMKDRGIKPSEACFSTMMLVYVNADLPQQALQIIEEMKKSGVARAATAELSAIVVHASLGQTDEALTILRKLVSEDVEVNITTINMVLMAIEKDRRGDAILDVIRAMRLGRIEPDARGNKMIISTYSLCGQTEEALMVLRRLLNDPRNLEVEPSCAECVISGCLKKSNADEALQVLRIVETRVGREPVFVSEVLVAQILDCLTNQGRWHQVQEIFYEVRKRRKGSSVEMFQALLRAMKQGKNSEGEEEVISLMRSDGLEISKVIEDGTVVPPVPEDPAK
jgi:pentatricopeptide repeat protein